MAMISGQMIAEAWEAALAPAIAGALAAAGVAADAIGALAIAGQLDGCVAVDANGTSVHATGPAEWSKKIVELKLPVTAA